MFDKKIDNTSNSYGDDAIVTLSPREHIRLRPGMYIGKLGDGSQADDGIYVLIKEVVDNSVDEFIMGAGKQIDVTVEDDIVTVRDYGRGIPLKSLAAAVSEMNTGGKYGGSASKKTVGLNGVGVKAVNMLSSEFTARSVRDGEARTVTFAQGLEQSDRWESGVQEKNGTFISFRVDREVFGDYSYNLEYVEQMIRNYTYLNLGLTLPFQRPELCFEERLAGPPGREHDRRAALCADPPFGRGYRSGHRTRYGLRRELLFVRQWTIHLAGRYASGGFP